MPHLHDMFELNVCKAIRELECFLCWSTMLLFVALDQKNQEGSFVTQRYASLTKISSSDAVTVDSVYILVFGNLADPGLNPRSVTFNSCGIIQVS